MYVFQKTISGPFRARFSSFPASDLPGNNWSGELWSRSGDTLCFPSRGRGCLFCRSLGKGGGLASIGDQLCVDFVLRPIGFAILSNRDSNRIELGIYSALLEERCVELSISSTKPAVFAASRVLSPRSGTKLMMVACDGAGFTLERVAMAESLASCATVTSLPSAFALSISPCS